MNVYLESGELCVDSDAPDIEIHAVDPPNDLYVVQRYSANYDGLAEAVIVKHRRGMSEGLVTEMSAETANNWRWRPTSAGVVADLFQRADAMGRTQPAEVREPYNRFDPKNWGV